MITSTAFIYSSLERLTLHLRSEFILHQFMAFSLFDTETHGAVTLTRLFLYLVYVTCQW